MKFREIGLAAFAIVSTVAAIKEYSQKCEYRGKYEALKDMTGKALRESSRQSYNNGKTQNEINKIGNK